MSQHLIIGLRLLFLCQHSRQKLSRCNFWSVASASTGSLWEMQTLLSAPDHCIKKSGSPSILCFNKHAWLLWCMLTFWNQCCSWRLNSREATIRAVSCSGREREWITQRHGHGKRSTLLPLPRLYSLNQAQVLQKEDTELNTLVAEVAN